MPNKGSVLFTPIGVGTVVVPNRFVRSATQDYMALDDGTVTDRQIDLYRSLAAGEVGLIVTGHAFVQPSGKASPRQLAIHDDRFVPGLSRLAAAVRAEPSRIFVQLAHAGRQTKTKYISGPPVSPSAVVDPTSGTTPREMSAAEIRTLIRDFVRAALRAKSAGFDGVQIHAAHGYLLSSFLSPHTNRRNDDWGGTLPNRVRIVAEIISGIKEAAGRDFPLMVKLNSTDFMEGGLTVEESVEIASALETAGIDAIEVSGGMAEAGRGSVWQGLRAEADEGYFVSAAASVKKAVHIPVSGLGGIRTFAAAEKWVKEARVDLISLCRPLIRDPDLVRGFRTAGIEKSECISCNKCFNPRGIRCAEIR